MEAFDIIIIGGGPAGISAAIYSKSRGMKTLLLEKDRLGGLIGKVSTVTHYTGIVENETGAGFAKRMEKQVLDSGVVVRFEKAVSVDFSKNEKIVSTDKGSYTAKAVIIASGNKKRSLGIPGEAEFGALNAARDWELFQNKDVYVLGGADGAVKEALFLANHVRHVFIIHFEDKLGSINEFKEKVEKTKNITLLLNRRLCKINGKAKIESLELENVITGEKEEISCPGSGLFIYAGNLPDSSAYDVEKSDGYIKTDEKMQTSLKGVFAAGDVNLKQVRQVATAVNDGAIAAINAVNYINSL